MASDRSDPFGGRVGSPPDGIPRDRILTQVTPREGWTGDQQAAIAELCAMVVARYPDAELTALRWRLGPLLTKSVGLVAVGKLEGKKPATIIRDEIEALRDMPPNAAVEKLQDIHPVLRDRLDLRLEAEDPEVDRPVDPELGSYERAAQRYALVMLPDPNVLPQPRRGTENPWATVAELVAELLADVTGREPKRTFSHHTTATTAAGADSGWPLTFFRRFAALAVPSTEPPRLDRVWRNALDARKRK